MKKTFVRCLALAIVIGLSLGSLTYAKGRPGGSPLGASDTAAAREVNVERTNLERVVIPAADTRGVTPPVMNVKAREKRMRVSLQRSQNHIAMATLPVTANFRARRTSSLKSIRQDEQMELEGAASCMGTCLKSAGINPTSVLICAASCLAGLVAQCAICLGVEITIVALCGLLCLVN